MKLVIALMMLTTTCYAGNNSQKITYNMNANGSSKGEALARAIERMPYGAKIEKVMFNGYSIRTCTSQTGRYTCTLKYSK
jgi:hypothetical protein